MLKFADGQTDGRTDRVITIGHPPSGGALINHLKQPSIAFENITCTDFIIECIHYTNVEFSTSLQPLYGIQPKLTGSKVSTSSTKFVFFGPIGKTRWPPSPDLPRHFRLLLWHRLTEFNQTWQEARFQRPIPSLFFGPIGNPRLLSWPLIGWDIFDFSSERNSTKLDRKQDLNVLCQVFSGRSEKQDGRRGLWFAETFSISILIPPKGIQRYLTGSKILMSSAKLCIFWPFGMAFMVPD